MIACPPYAEQPTEADSRAGRAYRAVSTFWTEARATVIDLLKSAPRWFLMLVVSGSVAFGCAAGTMCGMVIVDSLSRIERYSRDVWQVQLAELADRMGKQESRTDHHAEEFKRRAEDDAAFRAEMRREFDRLNFRLTQKGR